MKYMSQMDKKESIIYKHFQVLTKLIENKWLDIKD